MKDGDLPQRLAAFIAPPPTDAARHRARHRALIAFQKAGAKAAPVSHDHTMWRVLAGAAALAAVAAIIWLATPPERVAAGTSVLAQIETLFPDQLDAVVERDGAVQLALAPAPRPSSDQPVLVEFRRGASIVRVHSYSGRRVCIDLSGRPACFEALLSDAGQVIVAGDDFVWTPQDRVVARGWSVTATALKRAS